MDKSVLKKHSKTDKPKIVLADGRKVIGEEIDELNRLWYVILDKGELVLERANKKRILRVLEEPKGITIFVQTK